MTEAQRVLYEKRIAILRKGWEVRAAQRAAGKVQTRPGIDRRQAFVTEYLSNGRKATAAYIKAYQGKDKKKAWQTLHNEKVQELIASTEKRLAASGQGSVDKLIELRDSGESEKVQLGAAKAIMDSYSEMMKRQIKATSPEYSGTTNILVTSMTDADIIRRIGELGAQGFVPRAIEAEVQDGPTAPYGGDLGLQEPGTDSPGGGDEPDAGGGTEAGPVLAPTGAPQVDDDHGVLRDPEDHPETGHPDTHHERAPGQLEGVPAGDQESL